MAKEHFTSSLDRRVTLKKPIETRDPVFNEPKIGWEVVVQNLPAGKKEAGSGGKEDLVLDSVIRSEVQLEWQIRFFGQQPKSSWVLIDEYGTEHKIVAPPTEIGRRMGWILKTIQIE